MEYHDSVLLGTTGFFKKSETIIMLHLYFTQKKFNNQRYLLHSVYTVHTCKS